MMRLGAKLAKAADFGKIGGKLMKKLIQYLHKNGLAPKDVHIDIVATYKR
jgi:hypothetical protein